MELLASLPAQVSFSEIAPVSQDSVPLENLDPHERALLLVKEEGIDYAEAIKKSCSLLSEATSGASKLHR